EAAGVVGRVVDLQLVGDALRLGGGERLVERGRVMGVELVHDQHDRLRVRVADIDQVPDQVRPIGLRPLPGHGELALAQQRLTDGEDVGDPVADVLAVEALGLARGRRQGQPHFPDQLLADLVHADQGALGIERAGVDVEHILHVVDELGIRLRGDHPLPLAPGSKLVFFRARRTVSWETPARYASSTSLLARRRRVQRASPVGGLLQAKAIRWASAAPSILCSRGLSGRRGSRAASSPSSTNRLRTRSAVGRLTSTASPMAWSGSPWSAFNNTRAWISRRAAPLPDEISARKLARSASLRVTMYFLSMHQGYISWTHSSKHA